MYARNVLGLGLALLAMVLLMMSACSENEGAADGDTPTDGDGGIVFGTCTSNNDCPASTSCLLIGDEYLCAPSCTGDADCQALSAGSCCDKIGSGFFCKPLYACGTQDGDEPDADVDGDEPVDGDSSCVADTYRCGDYKTVERCGVDGSWSTYKPCGTDSCCYQGDCISMEGGNVQCEGNTYCIPDTYKCRGAGEVQRCSSDGSAWEWYRDCTGAEMCVDGGCVDLSDGDVPDGDTDGDEPDGDDPDGDEPEVCDIPCTIEEGCEADNQYCFDKKPTDDEPGCCELFCDLEGAPNCPRGFTCQQGTCQQVDGYCISDADCEWNKEFCYKRPGASDGLCEEFCFNDGNWCPSHARCEENPDEPNYGKCVYDECEVCSFDQQCVGAMGPNFYCNVWLGQNEGCCIERCGEANPCAGGLTCCDDGRCGVNCGQESCTKVCAAGYRCDPLYDECVLNCPPCGKNECCDAASAPNCYTCECQNPIVCGVLLKPCCFGYSCSAIVYGVLGYCI